MTILTIVEACAAMAMRDAVGTFLTIAESRGRALMSGTLDAIGDLAGMLVTLAGVGEVMKYGWHPSTIALMGAMMVTSFFGTITWTKIGNKLGVKK